MRKLISFVCLYCFLVMLLKTHFACGSTLYNKWCGHIRPLHMTGNNNVALPSNGTHPSRLWCWEFISNCNSSPKCFCFGEVHCRCRMCLPRVQDTASLFGGRYSNFVSRKNTKSKYLDINKWRVDLDTSNKGGKTKPPDISIHEKPKRRSSTDWILRLQKHVLGKISNYTSRPPNGQIAPTNSTAIPGNARGSAPFGIVKPTRRGPIFPPGLTGNFPRGGRKESNTGSRPTGIDPRAPTPRPCYPREGGGDCVGGVGLYPDGRDGSLQSFGTPPLTGSFTLVQSRYSSNAILKTSNGHLQSLQIKGYTIVPTTDQNGQNGQKGPAGTNNGYTVEVESDGSRACPGVVMFSKPDGQTNTHDNVTVNMKPVTVDGQHQMLPVRICAWRFQQEQIPGVTLAEIDGASSWEDLYRCCGTTSAPDSGFNCVEDYQEMPVLFQCEEGMCPEEYRGPKQKLFLIPIPVACVCKNI